MPIMRHHRYLKELTECEAAKVAGELHQAMDKHRRGWSIATRQNLAPRQMLIWMDFYSFFSKDQLLVHTMCFVLEWKNEAGILQRKYVDVACMDKKTNSANNYFIAAAWLKLLEDTDLLIDRQGDQQRTKFDRVFVCCDNAIVSKYHAAVLLVLDKMFRLCFELCPLCPRHASSLADSHAGHIKPTGKKLELKEATAGFLKSTFEEVIGGWKERFKDTLVLELPKVDKETIDNRIYKKYFGHRDNIRGLPALRTFSQLVMVRGQDDDLGFVKARKRHNEPTLWSEARPFPS